MSLTTRSLRLHLLSVLNAPLAGAKVTLQLSAYQADGTDIVPLVWELPEDELVPGDYVAAIWPNTRGDGGTHYDLLVQANGQQLLAQIITVTEGVGEATMKARINVAPYPPVYAAASAVRSANTFSDSAGESASRALAAAATQNRNFPTPEAGVNPTTGVPVGHFFNVHSSDDDVYLVEYENVNGVAVPTGKTFPSTDGLEQNFVNVSASIAQIAAVVIDNNAFV